MADKDFDDMASGRTRGEAVRPSLVVSTSKLLGVTESIASMNLRIAGGVVFCAILLVATFIINVVAFDYAKETKTDSATMFVVDKDSGEVTNFHPKFAPFVPQLNFKSLSEMKEVSVMMGPEQPAKYLVSGVEQFKCPVEGSKRCTKDGALFVLTTVSGVQLYAVEGSNPDLPVRLGFITDPTFVAKAREQMAGNDADVTDLEATKNRHLLHAANTNMFHCSGPSSLGGHSGHGYPFHDCLMAGN